ncbi:MAG: polyphosphate kinase 2 family protein [Acidimicrobiales bacterium]|nr:polyphosphate kinase 2 family protein [Acidimicrobiales bacterium]MCB9393959.1 polyphosphate kinase 2 family protein [Acidimicrobiaceae bacterium]
MADQHRDLDDLIDALRVRPDEAVDLRERPTDADFGMDKEAALARLADTRTAIDLLQQRLYAEGTRSVLLVVQAMDAAGKDGTIRNVLTGLNPAGIHVTSFKAPGGPEVQHDYLWRVHQAVPRRGEIGVFNRSHYEDVLVVRVKRFVPETVWRRRYEHIRHFEQLLTDEGTTVVKVFLHVSKDEQARRFQERLDDPEKRWKFRAGDLDDRALWDDFQAAYTEAIERTTTKDCPWYVVPADSNSRRNMAVGEILRRTLERLDPRIPDPEEGLDGVKVV